MSIPEFQQCSAQSQKKTKERKKKVEISVTIGRIRSCVIMSRPMQ